MNNDELGRMAYEAWWGESDERIVPSWETLFPEQRDGWCRAAATLWQAGYEADSDLNTLRQPFEV